MIKKFFKGIGKGYIIPCLVLIVIWAIFNCIFVELSASLITRVVNDGYSDMSGLIFEYVIVVVIWITVEYVHDMVSNILFLETQSVTDKDGFRDMYNTKPEIIKKHNSGYITGLIRSLEAKRSDLMNCAGVDLMMDVAYVGYFTIRMLSFHWIFSLALVGSVVGGNLIRLLGRRLVMRYTTAWVESEGVMTKTFIDISTNINTVQKMQADKFMADKIDNTIRNYKAAYMRSSAANHAAYMAFKLVVYMYAPLCIWLVNSFSFDFDYIEFYAILAPLSVQLVHMAKGIGSFLRRVNLYTSSQIKLDSIINQENMNTSSFIKYFNKIEVVGADYAYVHDITKKHVRIQIPYMSIDYGDKVCLYGESGQGKTTALNIISRQLETDNVYIDGKQSNDRLSCVFISQDTEIFDMSIRDNLTLGNSAIHDYELETMLDAVGMGEWLKSQEYGLDTMLGERGVFVSTGQRQRLNLIRGLLIRDKELYLLDEPTSNVDEDTEQKMVKLIDSKLSDKTYIIVSHRKAIMSICNKFYKFENGICGSEETGYDA